VEGMSKRLSDAPGYDKFVMSFADKIAQQLDAEKSGEQKIWEKDLELNPHKHDFQISEDDEVVSCKTCHKEWIV
jgi:hypothetical protein